VGKGKGGGRSRGEIHFGIIWRVWCMQRIYDMRRKEAGSLRVVARRKEEERKFFGESSFFVKDGKTNEKKRTPSLSNGGRRKRDFKG